MRVRRYLVLVGALAIALSMGAAERGAADTVEGCAGDGAGKPLCARVTDLAWASVSPSDSDRRYMTDSVSVGNSGTTSNLVNITVTITWADEGVAETTSVYMAQFSDPDCVETAPQTLTCATPTSLGPGDQAEYGPLVFGTATDEDATGTTVTVHAATKEQKPPPKGGSNVAFVDVSNTTPYEPRPDEDLSIAGGGITTTLATARTGSQFSRLSVPLSDADGDVPRGLFELREESYGAGGATCPAGLTCFSGAQHVETVADGLGPVNLWITYTGRLAPGATENSIVVVHDRAGGTPPDPVTISSACDTGLFSGDVPSSIPCRTVEITHLPGGIARVEIDVWDIENGQWDFG